MTGMPFFRASFTRFTVLASMLVAARGGGRRVRRGARRHLGEASRGLVISTFGHAGDGHLHPTIVFDPRDDASSKNAYAAFDEIVRAASDLGGSITGEHGVGSWKRDDLTAMVGKAERALMGSGAPEKLVASDGTLDVQLEPVRWAADGSGFVFVASSTVAINGTNTIVRGLYAFDMAAHKVIPVVVPQVADTAVVDGAAAPDATAIVYCLREGTVQNLHFIDLTKSPATDAAITNDGKSCHPIW